MTKEKASYLRVKDHTVSKEEFELRYVQGLDMLETYPQPTESELPRYYVSEEYISHTDSKRNLFEKAYHFVRKISLNKKVKLIDSFAKTEKRLLDVGCGTGDFLHQAQKNNWEVCGVEPNEEARALANDKTDGSVFNVDELLKFEKESFNVITLWHVLEHLPKLDEHIRVLEFLLKENGRMIIAVPNYKSYDAKKYKEFWAAYDAPRHLWHFSQTSIIKLFDRVNMKVEKILPLKFDAYYVSLLSEKYKSGSMNFFKAISVGLRSNLKARRSNEYSSLIYILKKV